MSIETQTKQFETGANPNLIDRRDSPRHDIQLLIVRTNGWSEKRKGNLGIGGCYFTTGQAPTLGEKLRVNLDLEKQDRKIEIDCRVIRLVPIDQSTGVAAKFEELPFETERAIARWLDSHC